MRSATCSANGRPTRPPGDPRAGRLTLDRAHKVLQLYEEKRGGAGGMRHTMQDYPLRVHRLIDHAAREHGARELVSFWAAGGETRSGWATVALEARKLAQALRRLGVVPGDRVATLAMNSHRHLIAWYGAIGMGGIVHTLNPRLFDDQLTYIVKHAADRVLLYDRALMPLVERLRPAMPTVEHWICLDDDEWTELLAREDGDFAWIDGDERDPCMLCYTSGTTGNPKGVLYDHRSTTLHAIAGGSAALMNLSARAVAMPIVPMFHAAAWGAPFAAAIAGAKLVFSQSNEAATLCRAMNRERVTHTAGVPTVWLAMFQHIDATGERPAHLEQLIVGGAAAPRAMIARLMDMGIDVRHLWGMTEMSPIGTAGIRPPDWDALPRERQLDLTTRQGRTPFGIEMRIVDDAGTEQPRDGTSPGRLQVRGQWVIKRYYRAESDAIDADGWFDTGDVAVIHPDGSMQITDRSKDIIKSGGEWISSVELENAAIGLDGVVEAAAIGVPHPKWDERPLLIVVRRPDSAIDEPAVIAHLASRVAKWWLPDRVLFADAIPHTATGKILKTELRARYGALYRLAESA